ncbi:MAG: sulfotransferase [Candidatus Aminicenantes bacterium]|nr:sulfotransferase [Candidatus Aminicenantes bacterium]
MKKLVYIASLSRSGSTLVDLILGGHSSFIGLGEVWRLVQLKSTDLKEKSHVLCSCGVPMSDCVFWGKVIPRLMESETSTEQEKYQILLDSFFRFFGEDRIPVDSSKYAQPLQLLHEIQECDLKVLYIIKDVRSFINSHIDAAVRNKSGRKNRNSFYQLKHWYLGNKNLQRFLKKENIPYFQFGYEEISLYPELIIQKMCDFLGVDPEPSMRILNDSGSHSVLGNRMRFQQEKLQRIFYDHRWFSRKEWMLPAFLFPKIMRFNADEVYKNGTEKIWKM